MCWYAAQGDAKANAWCGHAASKRIAHLEQAAKHVLLWTLAVISCMSHTLARAQVLKDELRREEEYYRDLWQQSNRSRHDTALRVPMESSLKDQDTLRAKVSDTSSSIQDLQCELGKFCQQGVYVRPVSPHACCLHMHIHRHTHTNG